MLSGYGKSTKGKVRTNNQDAIYIDNVAGIWIVADGMGGHAGGQKAAYTLCTRLPELIQAGTDVPKAIKQVHTEILTEGLVNPNFLGMGATLVLAQLTSDDTLMIYWLGDCRAYQFLDAKLRCITKDHSKVQQYIDAGVITEEQALNHPQRNIVTQCVGGNLNLDLNIASIEIAIKPKNQILLCSDGLYTELSFSCIESCLADTQYDLSVIEETVDKLVDLANKQGGKDNISVIVLA